MQSLQYATTGSQTIAVWPDTPASSSTSPFRMVLSSDYDRSSTVVDLTLQNTPTSVLPRLVFSFNKAQLPSYTGNYTLTLQEAERFRELDLIWGETEMTWTNIQAKWSDPTYIKGGFTEVLDIDRAWISGSDVPSFTQYTTSSSDTIYESGSIVPPPTQYLSPDETGSYITYHG